MKDSTFLFIDGSNLYASQYSYFGPHEFLNFPAFITAIETSLDVTFSKIYFYASYSPKPAKPTKKQVAYLTNEGLFYRSVKSQENVIFFKGYRSRTSGKEKEVDVKIAVDLVDMAWRKKYSQAYLMTGDADFLHALFAVEKQKKQVSLICMANHIMFKGSYYFNTYIIKPTLNKLKENLDLSNTKTRWLTINMPTKKMVQK